MYISDIFEMLIGIALLIIGAASSIFFLIVLWAWHIGPRECSDYGDAMMVVTKYKFWGGCFVTMPDGRILPKDISHSVLKQEYKIEMKSNNNR